MVKGKRNDVNLQCINILHHNLTNPNQKPTLHCCLLSCIFPAKKKKRGIKEVRRQAGALVLI